MADVLGFFRSGGKIIPITKHSANVVHGARAVKAAKIVGGAAVSSYGAKKIRQEGLKNTKIKVNQKLDLTSLGLSIASGVISAASFTGGVKRVAGGALLSHAVDALGTAATIGSVAGKGQGKERAKQAAKQEARNFVVGNAVYAAGIIGVKKNRQAVVGYAKKILEYGRKAVRVAEVIE